MVKRLQDSNALAAMWSWLQAKCMSAGGVKVAVKVVYNLAGLSSTKSIKAKYEVDFEVLSKMPRHRHINRCVSSVRRGDVEHP